MLQGWKKSINWLIQIIIKEIGKTKKLSFIPVVNCTILGGNCISIYTVLFLSYFSAIYLYFYFYSAVMNRSYYILRKNGKIYGLENERKK